MFTGAARLASTWDELGEGLRRLRGDVSLRSMEARTSGRYYFSKSTLGRLEAGSSVPKLEYAEALDDLYGGQGWVELSVKSLWRSKWDPWSAEHGVASHGHEGSWPAQHAGDVWILLAPLPSNETREHHVTLHWGDWTQTLHLKIPALGLTLRTGKAIDADGISKPCHVRSDMPVFSLYGAGDVDDANVLDIARGWRHAP